MSPRHFSALLACLLLAGGSACSSVIRVSPTYRDATREELPATITRLYLEDRAGLSATTSHVAVVTPPGIPKLLEKAVPIDFATVLTLAGEKPNIIRLAKEKAAEKDALVDKAVANMLPTPLFDAPDYEYHNGWQQWERNKLNTKQAGNPQLAYNESRFYVGLWNLMVDRNYFNDVNVLIQRQHERNAAEYRTEQATVDTIAHAAELYFDLAVAQAELESVRSSLKLKREAEALQRKRVKQGVAIELDHEETETELATAAGVIAESEARFLTASAALATLLRLEPTIVLYVPPDVQLHPLTFVSPDAKVDRLIDLALTQRPDLSAASEEVTAAERGVTAATYGPLFPWVRAGLFGRDGGIGIEGYNPRSTMHGREDYLLALEWHLDGMGVGIVADYRAATANLRAAEIERDDTRERIMYDVIAEHQKLVALTVAFEHAVRRYRGTRDNLHVSEERHEQGTETYDKVLKARQVHTAALRDVVGAIANYNKAQYKLLSALGERPNDIGGAREVPR